MPKRSSKKKKKDGDVPATPPLDPFRRGMPAPDSIVEVKEFKREGKPFRIIKTTEMDEYDRPPAKRKKPQR